MPMCGLDASQLFDDFQKPLARVAAMHEFQKAIAAALHRDVRAFDRAWAGAVGFDQIIAVTFGMRRSEANAFEAVDFVDGFEQLDKSGFAVYDRDVAFAVAGDDLAEQRDFLHAARDQFAAFGDDIGDGAAAFFAARVGHDAEGAVLIAALHDADEGGDGFRGRCR